MQLVARAFGGQCEPGQPQGFVSRHVIAAQVEQPEVEHRALVAPGGGLLVQRQRLARLACLQCLVRGAEIIVAGQVAFRALGAEDPPDVVEVPPSRLRRDALRHQQSADA